jgi:pimeloyl-ACP methyl ester carboxylesterase
MLTASKINPEAPAMAHLTLSEDNALYYEYAPPGDAGRTFVFVNALTGNTGMWEAEIGPALRADGYGTLVYNFRGQAESSYTPGTALSPALITADLEALLAEVAPPGAILVGLSIGGMFAAEAILNGAAADGLVLMNTLRKPGLRLDWINTANARAAGIGGTRLLIDLFLPLLVNGEQLAKMRGNCLDDAPYAPPLADDPHLELLTRAVDADWDLPYEAIGVPTLVMTGLRDHVFYVAADVAELTARLPNAQTVELQDSGHLIPAERPQATIEALRTFAASL